MTLTKKNKLPDSSDTDRPEAGIESLYSTIREQICLLDYAPSERLSEEVLAQTFAVSRTPIRRVLGQLETEGLVTIRHGAGNFVTEVETGHLIEIYRFRMEVAPLIGQLSPRSADKAWLNRARQLKRQCQAIRGQGLSYPDAKREFARLNMRFFELLMELVGNRALQETLERLFYRSARMWPFLMGEAIVIEESAIFAKEIGQIIALLERGGLESVGHLRRTHIDMAMQRFKKLIKPEPEIR